MKFNYEGFDYVIEFERKAREGAPYNGGSFKNPTMTTVNILRVTPGAPKKDWPVFRTSTVGCAHNDTFSYEGGRYNALKALTRRTVGRVGYDLGYRDLTREFTTKMWNAYFGR